VLNPLELVWYWNSFFLYFTPFLVSARIWYWRDFMYFPNKLFLLRGGRVLKVEAQSLGNLRYIYWVENQFLRPLTQDKMRFDDRDAADFLTEEGQLKYDLNVEAEELRIWGVNMNVGIKICRMNSCTSSSTALCTTLSSSKRQSKDTTSIPLTLPSILPIMSDTESPIMINDVQQSKFTLSYY
jgi:hypothetical protein